MWPFDALARSSRAVRGAAVDCHWAEISIRVCRFLLESGRQPVQSKPLHWQRTGCSQLLFGYTQSVNIWRQWSRSPWKSIFKVILAGRGNEDAVAGGVTGPDSCDWCSWLCTYWYSPDTSLCSCIACVCLSGINKDHRLFSALYRGRNQYSNPERALCNRSGAVRGPETSWAEAAPLAHLLWCFYKE